MLRFLQDTRLPIVAAFFKGLIMFNFKDNTMSATTQPTPQEEQQLLELVAPYIDIKVLNSYEEVRKHYRIDKRENMYGGEGTVYLIQLYEPFNELVNNRIGCYMILPTTNDWVGFHEHGKRKEQELYVVLNGEGAYHDKIGQTGEERITSIMKGNVTTVKGESYHSVRNISTSNEPLILFVITTNEK